MLAHDNGYDLDKLDEEDDKDSEISDTTKYEHERDEQVYTFDKTVGDNFLNKLSGDRSDDDESNNVKDMEVACPCVTTRNFYLITNPAFNQSQTYFC